MVANVVLLLTLFALAVTAAQEVRRRKAKGATSANEQRTSDYGGCGGCRHREQQPTQQRAALIAMILAAGILCVLWLTYWRTDRQHSQAPSVGGGHRATTRLAYWTGVWAQLSDTGGKVDFIRDMANASLGDSTQKAEALVRLGMMSAWNFNQEEARVAFELGYKEDASCVMCLWGMAYARGPYLNKLEGAPEEGFPVYTIDDHAAAAAHAQHALRLALQQGDKWQVGELPGGGLLEREGISEKALLTMASRLVEAIGSERLPRQLQHAAAMVERLEPGSHAGTARRHAELRYATRLEAMGDGDADDVDAYALAAEAVMNTCSWDFHSPSGGWTKEASQAAALLDKAVARSPLHPLGLHLSIHLHEAGQPAPCPLATAATGRKLAGSFSETASGVQRAAAQPASRAGEQGPARRGPSGMPSAADGLAAAERLDVAEGFGFGHLMHMPSHVYVRVGRYREAARVNELAHAMDLRDSQAGVSPYLPEHNLNMLVFASAMSGQLQLAERYAWEMRRTAVAMRPPYLASGTEYITLPLLLVRTGSWGTLDRHVLQQGLPTGARGVSSHGGQQISRVVRRFAKLMWAAHFAQLELAKALPQRHATGGRESALGVVPQQLWALQEAVASVPPDRATRPGPGVGIYAGDYHRIAQALNLTAHARVALLEMGPPSPPALEAAEQLLARAVAVQDSMLYMEPPRMHHPLRHCLGWVQLRAGSAAAAARTYLADLSEHPLNGWSLLGLHEALGALAADPPSADRPDLAPILQEAAAALMVAPSACRDAEPQPAHGAASALGINATRHAALALYRRHWAGEPLSSSCPSFQ